MYPSCSGTQTCGKNQIGSPVTTLWSKAGSPTNGQLIFGFFDSHGQRFADQTTNHLHQPYKLNKLHLKWYDDRVARAHMQCIERCDGQKTPSPPLRKRGLVLNHALSWKSDNLLSHIAGAAIKLCPAHIKGTRARAALRTQQPHGKRNRSSAPALRCTLTTGKRSSVHDSVPCVHAGAAQANQKRQTMITVVVVVPCGTPRHMQLLQARYTHVSLSGANGFRQCLDACGAMAYTG